MAKVQISFEGLNTLIDLRYKKVIKGARGANGLGKGMHGAAAKDIHIKVPLGTVITDVETGFVIADLTNKDDFEVVVRGGRGGRGNIAFATHSNPAPSYCENGEPGEIRKVKIELKLLADVGLVGLPSVGKSTIISKISASKPKIAAYHFTTLSPNLGVVRAKNNRSFVIADLPGLIEGASLGEGLGDQFLKHIERTRVIAHIIDMSGIEGRDPYDDYVVINNELENFNKKILEKPQIIIANKMDMDQAKQNLEMLDTIEKQPLYEEEKFESHVLYKFKKEQPFEIVKEGSDSWRITGKEIEKILRMTKFSTDESVMRFTNKLRKLGIDNKLRELGAKEGDTIHILDFEFDYKE